MDDDLKITGKNTKARGKLRIFFIYHNILFMEGL